MSGKMKEPRSKAESGEERAAREKFEWSMRSRPRHAGTTCEVDPETNLLSALPRKISCRSP